MEVGGPHIDQKHCRHGDLPGRLGGYVYSRPRQEQPLRHRAKQMGPYNTETETPQTPTITAAEAHA